MLSSCGHAMFKLKRLKIVQYRNVRPGTELRFDDGLNLILGQNASGKTTLLALLSAVCRSMFDDILDDEFALEYELHGTRFTVTAKVSHRRAEPLDAEQVIGAGPRWDDAYEIVLDDRVSQARTTIVSSPAPGASDRSIATSSVDLESDWSFVAAVAIGLGGDWVACGTELLQTFVSAYRFDESLDSFRAMTGEFLLESGVATPITASAGMIEHRGPPERVVLEDDFVPRALAVELRQAFSSGTLKRAPLVLGEAGRALSMRLARLLEVESVSIVPNVVEQGMTNSGRSLHIKGFTFEITRADGTTIHHDRLSYGQKRLLSFLYYLECSPHVAIADELVNGLHHRWIDACMEAIAGRQAFLTSQNPLLFDYVTFDSVERVQSSFITCKLELVEGHEQLVWQNMSAEEARIFFEAYEVGIEHVGDILITRGLW
jgi:energy-coupling factor transporter ATP-binding protein EcfA2